MRWRNTSASIQTAACAVGILNTGCSRASVSSSSESLEIEFAVVPAVPGTVASESMGFDANVYLVTLTLIALFYLTLAPRSMFPCLLSHIPWVCITPSLLLLTTSGRTRTAAHGSVCIED